MENKIEQVPGYIFDWLQKNDFDALSVAQQKEVLQYLTKEEYDELHSITQLTRDKSLLTEQTASRKATLLEHFDKKHSKGRPVVSLWTQPIAFWKVAALFLLFGFTAVQYYLFQQKKPVYSHLMAGCDTVYITKDADTVPIRVYDTVYQQRVITKARSSKSESQPSPVYKEDDKGEGVAAPNLNVISIQEMESMPNRRKGNSIRDDSLIQNHSFITL